MRRRRSIVLGVALLAAGPGVAWADGEPHDGDHGPAPHDDRYECPVNEHTEPAAGVQVFEEKYDYETGRKECVVFYTNPRAYDPNDTTGASETSDYGSWDPATQEDDDPNTYGPGDRGMRWSFNKQGPERGGPTDTHFHNHDPVCSADAQASLLDRVRKSLARYDGPEGVARATDEGYVFYPIAHKVYHAFNTAYYDDADPITGVQRDNVPEYPENIVYAMTDAGMKAMGVMFAMETDEETGELWKFRPQETWPDFTADAAVDVEGVAHPAFLDANGNPEVCKMAWHTHAEEEGVATSFEFSTFKPFSCMEGSGMEDQPVGKFPYSYPDDANVDGVDPTAWDPTTYDPNDDPCLDPNPYDKSKEKGDWASMSKSNPMSHIWGWGYDMWERGMDGTEASGWWVVYRNLPAICDQANDACL